MELLVRWAGGEQILLLGKPQINFAVASSEHRVKNLCPLSATSRQRYFRVLSRHTPLRQGKELAWCTQHGGFQLTELCSPVLVLHY